MAKKKKAPTRKGIVEKRTKEPVVSMQMSVDIPIVLKINSKGTFKYTSTGVSYLPFNGKVPTPEVSYDRVQKLFNL